MITEEQLSKLPDLLGAIWRRCESPIVNRDDAKTVLAVADDLLAEVKLLRVQASNYAHDRDQARAERDQAQREVDRLTAELAAYKRVVNGGMPDHLMGRHEGFAAGCAMCGRDRAEEERDRARAELAETHHLLAEAEEFITNTGNWDLEPSEQQIADWLVRWYGVNGRALPNVTEVVEIRDRPLRVALAEARQEAERHWALIKSSREATRRLTALLIANASRLEVPFTNAEGSPWSLHIAPAIARLREALGIVTSWPPAASTPEPETAEADSLWKLDTNAPGCICSVTRHDTSGGLVFELNPDATCPVHGDEAARVVAVEDAKALLAQTLAAEDGLA